jgi:single-stranded DNA-specific DHH superfamily exonuclease
MRKLKHNPIIGYHAIDLTMSVMGPAGTQLNPVFASENQAREAAKRYGQEKDFLMAGELWLGGVLGVVLDDVGDIQLDGLCAQRLVKACQRNGIAVNQTAIKDIDVEEQEPKYSSRQILTV